MTGECVYGLGKGHMGGAAMTKVVAFGESPCNNDIEAVGARLDPSSLRLFWARRLGFAPHISVW